jgi:hypothetical protein
VIEETEESELSEDSENNMSITTSAIAEEGTLHRLSQEQQLIKSEFYPVPELTMNTYAYKESDDSLGMILPDNF